MPVTTAVGMEPLAQSHEADQIEADLKAAIIEVYAAMIEPRAARINAYGMAHLGDFETVERFVKADGLAMDRRAGGEPWMRELYRGWRSHNPRRGLAFLRHYLQLLYPGGATVQQLWQPTGLPYPGGAVTGPGPDRFLTSRVRVSLVSETPLSEAEVIRVRGVMLSILPARMVLEMLVAVGSGFASELRLAAALTTTESVFFSGDAAPHAPTDSEAANVLALLHFDETAGATVPALALGTAAVTNGAPASNLVTATGPMFGAGAWASSGSNGLRLTATTSAAAPYTIEFFVKPVSFGSFGRFFAATNTGGSALFALTFAGGNLYYIDADTNNNATTAALPLNTWAHIAICFSGGTSVRVYVNSSLAYSSTSKGRPLSGASFTLGIGHTAGSIGGDDGQARFDEVRWTHGVDRYPSGLTVPTEAYPGA